MPPNEHEEPPSSTSPPSDSDSWEARVRRELDYLLSKQQAVAVLQEDQRKSWTRLTLLTKLEERRAEHVLKLTDAVTKDQISKDRNTDALLECTRILTEEQGHNEYMRAGIDDIRRLLTNKKSRQPRFNGAGTGGEGEGGGVVVRAISTVNVFLRAPLRSQLMLWLFLVTCGLAYFIYKQGMTWEAPQGVPIVERVQREPHFITRATTSLRDVDPVPSPK